MAGVTGLIVVAAPALDAAAAWLAAVIGCLAGPTEFMIAFTTRHGKSFRNFDKRSSILIFRKAIKHRRDIVALIH
jgi:hypothetical protein